MKKTVLQINSVVNWGSTGRIAEGIGEAAMKRGWESYIAYGRESGKSASRLIDMGSRPGFARHALITRLFDMHGLGSGIATKKLIREIERIQPDIIHLHNIHGYYINYRILFEYLSGSDIPLVWTLHDCWPFTGHCSHFSYAGCDKWRTGCRACPQRGEYPASFFLDGSVRNYRLKRESFNSVPYITFVAVSEWLQGMAGASFLGGHGHTVIANGVDTSVFRPSNDPGLKSRYGLEDKFVLLGAATSWSRRKGLQDYCSLREKLSGEYAILLVGLDEGQLKSLPEGIKGISRIRNMGEMAELYSMADIVLNLSYEETFGMTTAEGFACGTPGIVYDATASPELLTEDVGVVVEAGNIGQLVNAVKEIEQKGKAHYAKVCRRRAIELYDKNVNFEKYVNLYEELLCSGTRHY